MLYFTLLHYLFHNFISVTSPCTTDDGWCFIRNMSWLNMNLKNRITFSESNILFGWHDNTTESKDILNYVTLVPKYYIFCTIQDSDDVPFDGFPSLLKSVSVRKPGRRWYSSNHWFRSNSAQMLGLVSKWPWQKIRSKDLIPFKLGGPPPKMAISH